MSAMAPAPQLPLKLPGALLGAMVTSCAFWAQPWQLGAGSGNLTNSINEL
jgi:hypothetical protein